MFLRKLINLLFAVVVVLTTGLTLLILSDFASADEVYLSYGLGVAKLADKSLAQTKVTEIGYRRPVFGVWSLQAKVGGYLDGSGDQTRKSSPYVGSGLVYIIDAGKFVIRNGIGFVFTTADSMLGSSFNFNPEISIGFKDKKYNNISLVYSHFSNAGIWPVNLGKDFVMIQIGGKF